MTDLEDVSIDINCIKGLISKGTIIGSITINGEVHRVRLSISRYNPNRCSMCGRVCKQSDGMVVDKHHVLNRAWKPKFNFKIPLCRRCHDFVHYELPNGIIPHRMNSKRSLRYALQHNRVIIDNLIKLLLNEKDLQNFDTRDLILPYDNDIKIWI